jgi:Chemotaxis phosphatase CheX
LGFSDRNRFGRSPGVLADDGKTACRKRDPFRDGKRILDDARIRSDAGRGLHRIKRSVAERWNHRCNRDGRGLIGTGSISCSGSAACHMTSQMLGTEYQEMNEDVLDAVSEIANMIIGGFKTTAELYLGALGPSICLTPNRGLPHLAVLAPAQSAHH